MHVHNPNTKLLGNTAPYSQDSKCNKPFHVHNIPIILFKNATMLFNCIKMFCSISICQTFAWICF